MSVQIPGLPESVYTNSTTLMSPYFDDEVKVRNRILSGIPTSTKTWEDVPSSTTKKLSCRNKILKPGKQFSIETSNRFKGIPDEVSNPILRELVEINQDPNIECKSETKDHTSKLSRNKKGKKKRI